MRIEYKLTSSQTGGINETYTSFEEAKARIIYINEHKDMFKNSRMVFLNKYVYNDEGKITNDKLICTLDLR